MVFNDRFPVLFTNPTFPRFIESITNLAVFFYMANWIYPLAKPCSPFRTIRTFPVFKHSISLLNDSLCQLMVVHHIGCFRHGDEEIRPEAFSLFLMSLFCYNRCKPCHHSWMVDTFLNYVQYLYNHTFIAIMFT